MPHLFETRLCERTLDRLDRQPDGDLSAAEAAELAAHALTCPACTAEIARAESLAHTFRQAPRPLCPPEVTARVLARIAAAPAPRATALPFHRKVVLALRQLPHELALGGLLRPALAGGLAALLAVGAILTRPQPSPPFSPREIAEAQAQVELAFAYLGRMGSDTSVLVRGQVVENVIVPTRKGLSLSLPRTLLNPRPLAQGSFEP